jgi:hypothetical protein
MAGNTHELEHIWSHNCIMNRPVSQSLILFSLFCSYSECIGMVFCTFVKEWREKKFAQNFQQDCWKGWKDVMFVKTSDWWWDVFQYNPEIKCENVLSSVSDTSAFCLVRKCKKSKDKTTLICFFNIKEIIHYELVPPKQSTKHCIISF